jgi:hypothetical protein
MAFSMLAVASVCVELHQVEERGWRERERERG